MALQHQEVGASILFGWPNHAKIDWLALQPHKVGIAALRPQDCDLVLQPPDCKAATPSQI